MARGTTRACVAGQARIEEKVAAQFDLYFGRRLYLRQRSKPRHRFRTLDGARELQCNEDGSQKESEDGQGAVPNSRSFEIDLPVSTLTGTAVSPKTGCHALSV